MSRHDRSLIGLSGGLPPPGTLRSRVTALALLAVLLGLGWLGLVRPLAVWVAGDDTALLERRLDGYKRAIARRHALASELAELQARRAQSPDFLHGATAALAAADLQSRISAQIRGGGGQVDSTQGLPEDKDQGFRRVGAQIRMVGSIEAVRAIFYQIEAGLPRLFIDNLVISAPVIRTADTPPLAVEFNVYGYLPEEGK